MEKSTIITNKVGLKISLQKQVNSRNDVFPNNSCTSVEEDLIKVEMVGFRISLGIVVAESAINKSTLDWSVLLRESAANIAEVPWENPTYESVLEVVVLSIYYM